MIAVDGGDEEKTPNVVKVMRQKITHALPDMGRKGLNGHWVVAADTQTGILVNRGRPHESKGKPGDELEVFDNFARMAVVAKEMGFGHYQVIFASGLLGSKTWQEDVGSIPVELHRAGVQHLATSSGFEEYQAAYHNFCSKPPYSSNGLSAIDVKGISGGISLPVLTSMRMVRSVAGVEVGAANAETTKALKAAIFGVAVGFSPGILSRIHPDAIEAILTWDWLNQVVDKIR